MYSFGNRIGRLRFRNLRFNAEASGY